MRTKKQAMFAARTKSLNDVMRSTPSRVMCMNEIPSIGGDLHTTPSSHSNFTDDVYIPIVSDPCYNVEHTLSRGFEMDKLQVYREWLTRDDVDPIIRNAIQEAYITTSFEGDNTTSTKMVFDNMPR